MSARFDRSSAKRRGLLAKVHIAQVQLRLTDDDYRAVLLRVTGRLSAKDCTEAELVQLVKEFERLGFDSNARRPGRMRPADHPLARKARAMWISLGLLGAIDDPSDRALEAFARRQLNVTRFQWADQSRGYKLIEALKAIAERHGWRQDMTGVAEVNHGLVLKRRLVEALLGKLWQAGLIPLNWDAERAAWELAGWEGPPLFAATSEELERIAQAFGTKLQAAGHSRKEVA